MEKQCRVKVCMYDMDCGSDALVCHPEGFCTGWETPFQTPENKTAFRFFFHQTDDEDSAVGLKLEKAKEDAKLKAIIEKPKAIRVPLPVTKRELKNVASKPINARCFRTQFRVSLAFFF